MTMKRVFTLTPQSEVVGENSCCSAGTVTVFANGKRLRKAGRTRWNATFCQEPGSAAGRATI